MRKMNNMVRAAVLVATVVVFCMPVRGAVTNTFVTAGNWSTPGNWALGHVPINGEHVVISANVMQDEASADLGSYMLSSGVSHTFSGWANGLTASVVTIKGTMTHAVQTGMSTNASGDWVEDARVYVVSTNVVITAGGGINVDAKGFAGGPTADPRHGRGEGGGIYSASSKVGGGGYGGEGGLNGGYGGATYGSTNMPVNAGSGGAGGNGLGGNGGGVVLIDALGGRVTVDGVITASGGNGGSGYGGSPGAGGSGGNVSILCDAITGGGFVSANGGDTGVQLVSGTYYKNGGGGGGRVAITFAPVAQADESPDLTIQAAEGAGGEGIFGYPGTITMTSTNLLTGKVGGGQILIPGWTSWAVASVTVTNGTLVLPDGLVLDVSGNVVASNRGAFRLENTDVTVGGNVLVSAPSAVGSAKFVSQIIGGAASATVVVGDLMVDGGVLALQGHSTNAVALHVGGDALFTNAAALHAYASPTNDVSPAYGALFNVGVHWGLSTGCWVHCYSVTTNGGSPLFQAGSLTVDAGAGFNGDQRGFAGGYGVGSAGLGPGGGASGMGGGGGGGYGGVGGDGAQGAAGGCVYSVSNAPVQGGSGGGSGGTWVFGGPGGGLVRIDAPKGSVTVNGNISVNGGLGTFNGGVGGGGGSGGGVYITCARFFGSGAMSACGGTGAVYEVSAPLYYNKGGGGGGGGRIAVWSIRRSYTGSTDVAGGSGGGDADAGADGTVFWGATAPVGSFITVR